MDAGKQLVIDVAGELDAKGVLFVGELLSNIPSVGPRRLGTGTVGIPR